MTSKVLRTGVGGGGGGGLVGSPNAIVFIAPGGVGYVTDPALTCAPVDPFGRPQIRDVRAGGAGPVFRQGQWQSDGDPGNLEGDGIVVYGRNNLGVIDAANGGYARVKRDRFGIAQIRPDVLGGALYYPFRVDNTNLTFRRDDAGATITFNVSRATGNIDSEGTIKTAGSISTQADLEAMNGVMRAITAEVGSPGAVATIRAGGGPPLGAVPGVPGDIYLNTLGGPNQTLWVNETGGVGGWVPK